MRALALAVIAFSTPLAAAEGAHSDDDHLSAKDGVEILHAWTQATDSDHARVFMEIANEGDVDVVLLGGESDIAEHVHLMGLNYGSNGATEQEIEQFPIKAGAEIDLTPDGLFLELDGLSRVLTQGDEFEIHVLFEPIGEIEVHVEVEAAGATQHSHAGHNH